jgi:hypothetical protein
MLAEPARVGYQKTMRKASKRRGQLIDTPGGSELAMKPPGRPISAALLKPDV